MSLRPVLVVVLVLAVPAWAEDAPVEKGGGLTFRPLYWEQGPRYDLEIPLGKVVPEKGLLGNPLERRFALIGRVVGRLQVDAAVYGARGGSSAGLPRADVEVRRLIFGTRGRFFLLGSVRYAFEMELVAYDLEVGDNFLWWEDVPWVRTVKIGNYSPPMSLESIVSSRDITFMERATAVDALIPGRKSGFQIGGPERDQRLTWRFGMFANLGRTDAGDRSDRGGRAVGRVTWLLEDDRTAARLMHVGASASLVYGADDVQYRTRPESHLAPYLLDTGTLDARGAVVWGFEWAWIRGPWLFQAEHIGSRVVADDNSLFHGAYVAASTFLTGEIPAYDRAQGALARNLPRRPFSFCDEGWGSLRAGGRLSFLDLDDGGVEGGREINVTAGLTWQLNRYLLFKIEYGMAALDAQAGNGVLHFAQTRLQLDFY
jgi:phosphate-selective porin OprO/OprP